MIRSTRKMLALAAGAAVSALSLVALPGTASADWVRPMPTGDYHGYDLVFSDNFNGSSLDSDKWGAFGGVPGSDPGARFSRSHVKVDDGIVTLENYKQDGVWTGAGISNGRAMSLTSGRVEMRMRADRAPGISMAGLLWPKNNVWPPEIDFAEDRDGDRSQFTTTLHYGTRGDVSRITRHLDLDMTQWHTYAVEWDGNHVRYYVDRELWNEIDSSAAPNTAMSFSIQTNAKTTGDVRVSSKSPAYSRVQVDWVAAWKA